MTSDFLSCIKHYTAEPWHPHGMLLLLGLKLSEEKEKILVTSFNCFPHSSILDCLNLKTSADDKFQVPHVIGFISERVENMREEKKMLVTSIFSFPLMISKVLPARIVNPVPPMPNLGYSNSEASMMSKIWTNGDTII